MKKIGAGIAAGVGAYFVIRGIEWLLHRRMKSDTRLMVSRNSVLGKRG